MRYGTTITEFSAFGYNVHGMHRVEADKLVIIHGMTQTLPHSVIFSTFDRPNVKLKTMPMNIKGSDAT